jgi:hypothetical protein
MKKEVRMKKLLLVTLRLAIATALFLLVFFPRQRAEAAGVVGTGSPGSCTEEALDTALVGGGLVTFNCGAGPVTISLASQKSVAQDTTVDGGGKITLSGVGTARLFYIPGAVSLSLSNLTLTGGSADQGGAIYNAGQLTIANSTLYDNTAPGGVAGAIYNDGVTTIVSSTLSANLAGAGLAGAIYNADTLTVSNSTFSANFGGYAGGAIINDGSLNVSNSSFDHNQSGAGGAIDNNGLATISGSTFFSNTVSSGYGGAIYNGSTVTITASTFLTNTAGNGGAAIYNSGSAAIAGTTLSGNAVAVGHAGGGIYNDLSSTLAFDTGTLAGNSAPGGFGGGVYNSGWLTVTAATLSGNAVSAGLGGGVYNDSAGSLVVVNSTFSGNFGGMAGGGIIAGGPVTVTNCTFYDNYQGGLVGSGSDPFTVKNTIVANNTNYDCSGTITSLGHNLDGADTCAFAAGGDLTNIDPLVGPLADNGGPTLTHALLPGSPAINAGTNAGCPPTDQRGVSRPRFGTCDIGAFEFVLRVYLPLLLK